MEASDNRFLTLCKQRIEAGIFPEKQGAPLKQRDLEYLAELIENKSGIRISLSTMKRLWKDDYHQSPHPSTLNALVSLIDYEDWHSFKSEVLCQEQKSITSSNIKNLKWLYWPVAIVAGTALMILIFSAGSVSSEAPGTAAGTSVKIPEHIKFSANKTVTSGLPNSVIFHYDLTECVADSFFLQKSWNPANKIRIDPKRHYFSEIYYTPGFHWARIIANERIIQWAPVHILSDGWFAVTKYNRFDKIPTYLDQNDLLQNGSLSISEENFRRSKVDIDRVFQMRIYNVREFGGIDAHNFIFETRARCDSTRNLACPFIDFMFLTENGVFYIDLMTKGCISKAELKFGETNIYGRNSDLSAMGTNVYQWQTLEWTTEQKQVAIKLNGNQVLESSFKNDFGKIVGFIYSFTGPGSIDYFRLKNLEGAIVYSDEFEKEQL